MCNNSGLKFGQNNLKKKDIDGKDILEVGSLNINGSLRALIETMAPAKYIGVDITAGPGVDLICDVKDLIKQFGTEAFDVLISTEMLEHVHNWRKMIHNFKTIMKPGGIMLLTTRSEGFGYHGYPFDFWRYEISDIKNIFSDMIIHELEKDTDSPGVFVILEKPLDFVENDLAEYELFSIILGKRCLNINAKTINEFNKFYLELIAAKKTEDHKALAENNTPINFSLQQNGQTFTVSEQNVIDMFHILYNQKRKQTWENTWWMGGPLLKYPTDLWIYQEMLVELKPEIIIETGTFYGGSALYFALLIDMLNINCTVVTIDIEKRSPLPVHPKVTYINGSSVAPETITEVKKLYHGKKKALVILDSDHSKDHVLKEMQIYSQFVEIGSYLIVEDSNVNGHPIRPEWGPGPYEAIEEFIQTNNLFVIDKSREKFLLTSNPNGYLKRIS